MDYLKKFQTNELFNDQMQGGIWEDPITTLSKIKEIFAVATLTDSNKYEMEATKKTAKDKNMAVAFILGGSNYLD